MSLMRRSWLSLMVLIGGCAGTPHGAPEPAASPSDAAHAPAFAPAAGTNRPLTIGGAGMLFLGEGQGGGFNPAAAGTGGVRIRRALAGAGPLEDEYLARVARQLSMLPAALPAAGWSDLPPAGRLAGRMFLDAAARRCAYLVGVAEQGDPWARRWADGHDHAAEWGWWVDTVAGIGGRLQRDASVTRLSGQP